MQFKCQVCTAQRGKVALLLSKSRHNDAFACFTLQYCMSLNNSAFIYLRAVEQCYIFYYDVVGLRPAWNYVLWVYTDWISSFTFNDFTFILEVNLTARHRRLCLGGKRVFIFWSVPNLQEERQTLKPIWHSGQTVVLQCPCTWERNVCNSAYNFFWASKPPWND